MDAWKHAFFLQEKTHVHKIPRFRGGGIWVFFWGGECRFYFYGRAVFSDNHLSKFLQHALNHSKKSPNLKIWKSLNESPVIINEINRKSLSSLACQAGWYRMENGSKLENGKKLAKRKKLARNGTKWRKHGEDMGFVFIFFFYFWAIFPPFWAVGHFLFFGQFLPFSHFGPFSILCQAALPAI